MNLLRIAQEIWSPSPEWRWHELWLWQTVRAIDGSMIEGAVMRRNINGQWQYRTPTQEEQDDEAGARAW